MTDIYLDNTDYDSDSNDNSEDDRISLKKERIKEIIGVNPSEYIDDNIDDAIIVYTDGSSKDKRIKKDAGCGCWAYNSKGVIFADCIYLGNKTSNEAEYMGLILAVYNILKLKGIEELKNPVIFFLDSLLVVEQMNGKFAIKSSNMKPLNNLTRNLIKNFTNIKFIHIPRELNSIADKLSKDAVNNYYPAEKLYQELIMDTTKF